MSQHALLACPSCHGPVTAGATITCPKCGVVGSDEAWRIAWLMPGDLLERVEAEQAIWNTWATGHRGDVFPPQPSLREWLSEPVMKGVRRHYPELLDVAGKRVLDIGATLRFGVRFLKAGANRLDQVEVSAPSQEIAARRLKSEGIDPTDRVFFHTVPAETLPFPDGAFDIVFSSGTIAHTVRERSLPELIRVLRPGGILLITDAFLPRPLVPLMRLRRGLDRLERGTRTPLTIEDIRFLRSRLTDVRWAPFDVLWLLWGQLFGSRARERVDRIDQAMGTWGGLARVIGTQCWIAGRHPAPEASS